MQLSTFTSQKTLRDPIKFVFTILVVLVLVTSNAALEPVEPPISLDAICRVLVLVIPHSASLVSPLSVCPFSFL